MKPLKTLTITELINELSQYPPDMEVYYATKYALVPLEVKEYEGRCVGIDMKTSEKHKYKEK
ncbi:MAG: hypothetical protein IJF83_03050 [Methanobrevibacter sp.]|nr:hypothetical protein [Methanobrevibacter sp.]